MSTFVSCTIITSLLRIVGRGVGAEILSVTIRMSEGAENAPSKDGTQISFYGSHSILERLNTPHTERLKSSQTSVMVKLKLEAMSDEERREVMRKQIATFREKVKMCQVSYSTSIAETMMSQISNDSDQAVNSVWKLKRYVQSCLPQRASDSQVVYAQWYLSNFDYLKELKNNFDEQIFIPLSTMCCIVRDQSPTSMDGTTLIEEKSMTSLSIDTLHPTATDSILKYKNDVPEVKELYDYTDIDNAASRLVYIRKRWQHLLDDEREINASLFSFGSMSSVLDQSLIELLNILRLVPDILLKCSNAADLASQWLEVSSAKALDPETKLNKLERVHSVLSDKLSGVNDDLDSQEKKLESDSMDLDFLLEREERANEIMSKRREIEKRITGLTNRLKQAEEGLEKVQGQGKRDIRLEITRLQQEIKLYEYESAIMSEDLSVEMDIKPCIIRFADQLQNSCETLEQQIYQNKSERQNLETALVPVKEDKMKIEVELSRTNTAIQSPINSSQQLNSSSKAET